MLETQPATGNAQEVGKHSFLTGTVLVAATSSFAYGIAFVYEKGFCDFFSIPTSLIAVDITTVLVAAATLLGGAFTLLIYASAIFTFLSGVPKPISRSLRRLSPLLVLVLVYLALMKPAGTELLVVVVVTVLFLGLEFLFPLIAQTKTKGYMAKLNAQDEVDSKVNTLFDWLAKVFGASILLILLLPMVFFLAGISGEARAKFQEEYYVLESDPGLVVLKIYGDRLVCARLQQETKEVQPVFTVLNLTDSNQIHPIQLRLAKIGPLKLNKVVDSSKEGFQAPEDPW